MSKERWMIYLFTMITSYSFEPRRRWNWGVSTWWKWSFNELVQTETWLQRKKLDLLYNIERTASQERLLTGVTSVHDDFLINPSQNNNKHNVQSVTTGGVRAIKMPNREGNDRSRSPGLDKKLIWKQDFVRKPKSTIEKERKEICAGIPIVVKNTFIHLEEVWNLQSNTICT